MAEQRIRQFKRYEVTVVEPKLYERTDEDGKSVYTPATIAFVDEYGVIEGRAPGKTKVTTKINGTTVKIDVVVK